MLLKTLAAEGKTCKPVGAGSEVVGYVDCLRQFSSHKNSTVGYLYPSNQANKQKVEVGFGLLAEVVERVIERCGREGRVAGFVRVTYEGLEGSEKGGSKRGRIFVF